jgi:predicted transposase/invertase (TIGR01784 family)
MLMTEWNMDTALAVRFEEGKEEGLEEGLEKGRETEREEIAKNALAEGIPLEQIHKITGLDVEDIKKMQETLLESQMDR